MIGRSARECGRYTMVTWNWSVIGRIREGRRDAAIARMDWLGAKAMWRVHRSYQFVAHAVIEIGAIHGAGRHAVHS